MLRVRRTSEPGRVYSYRICPGSVRGPAGDPEPAPGLRRPTTASVFCSQSPRLAQKKNETGTDEADAGNGKDKGGTKEGPKHIRDNAFFVEEAANQEPGVVQHIFNWINLWDHTPNGRTRDFAFTYTMELPLGSQTHQFSFTTLFLSSFEKPDG